MGIKIEAGDDVTIKDSVVSADEVGGDKIEDGKTKRLSLPSAGGMVKAAAKTIAAAFEVLKARVGF